MRDCKIIQIGYTTALRQSARILTEGPVVVIDHPAVEREINRYLSQGYRIVNAYNNDGMWFVLERE